MKNKHLAGVGRSLSPAWVVSHCSSKSNRQVYVDKLKKAYLNVKVYGECGDLECKKGDTWGCMEQLERDHKFYLSFENALCPDYVTEKFFKVLHHDLVPIVFGGADYSALAPPHSYIDALGFDSIKTMAEYLREVHVDDAKYAEYFWWRDFYEVRSSKADGAQAYCDLCAKLHQEDNETPNVHDKLGEWWNQNDCHKLDASMVRHGGKIALVPA